MVCGKLGLNANVMMELRVHRWGPRSVMLRTVGASSWPQQLACFLHKTPLSTYFSNLFQEHLNIVCSSALIHTSWGTLSLWIHIASLHSSLTQLNTFYIVLLSCNIFHFVLCVLYAAHPDTTNSWKTWFCKGEEATCPFANPEHQNPKTNIESLLPSDIRRIPFILRLIFVHIFTFLKLGCCLYHGKEICHLLAGEWVEIELSLSTHGRA